MARKPCVPPAALRLCSARPRPRTSLEEVGTFGGDRDVTDLYNPVNFVLGGGVSFAWPARPGCMVAHARCGFGLNDLMKSDAIVSHTQMVEVSAPAGSGSQNESNRLASE